jgi:DTW domain-containing protein YfiP
MDKRALTEFLKGMTMFCIKHNRPIMRTEMIKRMNINPAAIKWLERNGHIEGAYYQKKTKEGEKTAAPWQKGYFPAGYAEAKKRNDEEEARKKKEEREILLKAKWTSASKLYKIWHWILTTMRLPHQAQRLYDKITR